MLKLTRLRLTIVSRTLRDSVIHDILIQIPTTVDFSSCTCDLTPKGCDHACCCDEYCDAAAVAKWRLTPGYCLDELLDQTIITFDDCWDRSQQPVVEDLQGGLYLYEKQARGLMCTYRKSDTSVTNQFIDRMFKAETSEEFDTIRDS